MKLRRLWAALRIYVTSIAPRLDLREVLISAAIGWFTIQGMEALAGPLPTLITSIIGLVVSLAVLFGVIPRVMRR